MCSPHFSLFFLDHSFTYATEKNDYDAEEKSRASRNGHSRLLYLSITSYIWTQRAIFYFILFFLNTSSLFSSVDSQKDPGRSRVPVVCLERLKILVSQLPPHGRRQSDPLPASGTEAPPPQSTWHPAVAEVWLILLLFVMRCWKIKGNQIQYFFFQFKKQQL